ncbi:MAG TPA: N-acyl homoserine lactonase family protein [Alicyclobacillus sp.]|nr:N-acyl homoserine lactonase family protein [Alicyclobacillus sp.]
MAVLNLYFLPVGRCLVDHSALDSRREPGVLVELPVWSYLIETTDGVFLVDTGMPESCIDDPEGLFRGTEDEGLIVPRMRAEDVITRVLARTGRGPDDLTAVINTHWHFDHAGGNRFFPRTEIVVQRPEHQAAMTQSNYFEVCKDPTLRYHLVDGDVELVPGVTLLATPGHTPGHQSVMVETNRSGPVLLTADASYCRENFEEDVPFAARDSERAAESIRRLRQVAADAGAVVFFGHDPEQAREWRTYPQGY